MSLDRQPNLCCGVMLCLMLIIFFEDSFVLHLICFIFANIFQKKIVMYK